MRIAFGADHAGLSLKNELVDQVRTLGHVPKDLGTHQEGSTDYPDHGLAVARAVAAGEADLGVLVCGTGIGMSMTADKVPGIRAAVCRTGYEARMARRHNDANVLCLGERVTGAGLAAVILESFLSTEFEGGRHARRVDKIKALDRERRLPEPKP